jgi:hypothetical protein
MINLGQNGEFKNILIKGMLAEGWRGIVLFVIAKSPKTGGQPTQFVIARLPLREAVAISIRDCFIASLLAMTIGWTQKFVIASPPQAGVAISIF